MAVVKRGPGRPRGSGALAKKLEAERQERELAALASSEQMEEATVAARQPSAAGGAAPRLRKPLNDQAAAAQDAIRARALAREMMPGRPKLTGRVLPNGQERVPFGQQTQKLAYPPIPGFVLRWFNDVPMRTDQALAAGWEFVRDANGQPVKRAVGRVDSGPGAMQAYLMKTPEEYYKEDQDAEQAELAIRLRDIRQGRAGAQLENQYNPPTHRVEQR